jgi:WD40 repeat protein
VIIVFLQDTGPRDHCDSLSSTVMAANTSPFQQLVSMKVHTDSINTIQFSPNGEYLATRGDDAHLFIFSSQTWKVQKKYMTVGPIRAIAWHKTPTGVVSFGIRSGIVITMILKVKIISQIFRS